MRRHRIGSCIRTGGASGALLFLPEGVVILAGLGQHAFHTRFREPRKRFGNEPRLALRAI
jgi:hypothetical protein